MRSKAPSRGLWMPELVLYGMRWQSNTMILDIPRPMRMEKTDPKYFSPQARRTESSTGKPGGPLVRASGTVRNRISIFLRSVQSDLRSAVWFSDSQTCPSPPSFAVLILMNQISIVGSKSATPNYFWRYFGYLKPRYF